MKFERSTVLIEQNSTVRNFPPPPAINFERQLPVKFARYRKEKGIKYKNLSFSLSSPPRGPKNYINRLAIVANNNNNPSTPALGNTHLSLRQIAAKSGQLLAPVPQVRHMFHPISYPYMYKAYTHTHTHLYREKDFAERKSCCGARAVEALAALSAYAAR